MDWQADRTVQTQCPGCGEWLDDLDGFGVLRHESCGYCSHASRDGDVCGLCGDTLPPAVEPADADA